MALKRKKEKNEKNIVVALDALGKAIRTMNNYGAKYDDYIDNAAIHGDDARAKQLIKQKIRVYALADQLTTLEGNIKLGAFTSQALSELGKLPAAIAGCKGLLTETPNFAKLGKSITSIFDEMNKSEQELAKLNDILTPKSVSNAPSSLDGMLEDEQTDQFKAEYRAMIARVKSKVSSETVVKVANNDVNNIIDDIDYAGIVAEENKKK